MVPVKRRLQDHLREHHLRQDNPVALFELWSYLGTSVIHCNQRPLRSELY